MMTTNWLLGYDAFLAMWFMAGWFLFSMLHVALYAIKRIIHVTNDCYAGANKEAPASSNVGRSLETKLLRLHEIAGVTGGIWS